MADENDDNPIQFNLDALKDEPRPPQPLPEAFVAEVREKRRAEAERRAERQLRRRKRPFYGSSFGAACTVITSLLMTSSSPIFFAGMFLGGAVLGFVVVWRRWGSAMGAVVYGGPLLLFACACVGFGWVGGNPFRIFPCMVFIPVSGALVALWRETEEVEDNPF